MNIIEKKYRILDKIGNGKFGIVYKAISIKNNDVVAIKTEGKSSPLKLLKNETTILKYLHDHGCRSTPIVYWYGVDERLSYLTISFYQSSLYEYCNNSNLIPEKISKIIVVCIDILETIHSQYVIHRDIKPQNFMISNEELFLIDFGFASFYIDENKDHVSDFHSDHIIGTPKYISPNIHDGNSPSRRDDLISLGYIYMYMCRGELPWENMGKGLYFTDLFEDIHIMNFKNKERKRLKNWEILEPVLLNLDTKIIKYLNYCYMLSYDETPNYSELKKLFT
uniref:non-specific serine/threonine protein kinase n=1 Tax=viral metagenome TaxID=1070528 RepID=A0A6C0JGN3_9ZZZZ